MRTFFFVVVLMAMCVGEALSAPPPFLRNPLTTNQITIGASMSIAGNVLESVGTGDVVGPASSTDSALAVFDGTTGKLLKNSVIISTNGTNLTIPGSLRISDGSLPNPSIVFASDDDGSGTGLYRSSANTIGFSINGLLMAYINSSSILTPNAIDIGNTTLRLEKEAAAILQIGSDSATATSQIVKGPDGLGTDKVGGDFTFGAGRSTGTGVPGKIHLTVSTNSITSASTQNAFTNVVTIGSDTTGLTFVNRARFDITTNEFILNTYYTNANQRGFVACAVGMTNILATERAQVALYLDQNGDGTWERTGIEVRLQGVIALSGSEGLSAHLQPNGRFIFTNLSSGATVSIIANSSQWVKQ